MLGMKQLTREQRASIIRCLVDGVSVRATCRITGFSKDAVQKLTKDLGEAVLEFHDNVVREVSAMRIQCDEIWCFCYSKDKNVPDSMKDKPGVGSIWTWTAMDADTKLIISWKLGARDATTGYEFMDDVYHRLAHRCQMTTDGHKVYLEAIEQTFGCNIDYAMLVKIYGEDKTDDTRYSPGKCMGTKKQTIMGNPDEDHISTSYAERQNLNIRMQNRRYTRLTNAFSKKAEMLAYSVAITFFYHNWVRIHQSLRMTPAMKAGLADRKWSIEDMVDLLPILSYNTRPKKKAD